MRLEVLMRVLRSLAFLCAALSASTASLADDCRWWLFECAGKKSAQEIAEAGRALGDSAVKSSDIAFSAINYWPWLISKYHTGTPDEKANAQKIIKGVFGADSMEGIQPFEITFSFEGIDSDKQKLDFILFRDYAYPNVAGKILVGNTIDFQSHAVTGKSWPVKESYASYVGDTAVIRERVRKSLEASRKAANSTYKFAGVPQVSFSGGGMSPTVSVSYFCSSLEPGAKSPPTPNAQEVDCSSRPEWIDAFASQERMVDAIMAVTDPKLDKLGSRPTIRFAYEGYKYLTLVFPEDQLRGNSQMKVSFSIHVKGKPDQPIPVMSSGPWSRSQSEIINGGSLHDTRLSSTKYRAFMVDLGVAGPPVEQSVKR